MNSSSGGQETPAPFEYDVVQTSPESISVKITESEPTLDSNYYDIYNEKIRQAPSWLVQDANFQGCVTKAVDNCVANTTQKEAQLLESDTLCDALPASEAANCKNQFHYTKAIRNKDISYF